MLEDLDSEFARCPGQPQAVLERMQMPGNGLVRGRAIAWAGDNVLHRHTARQGALQPVIGLQGTHVRLQRARLARRVGNVQVTIDTITINLKLGDALINELHRFQ